jgi:chloride channel protein, CIC family
MAEHGADDSDGSAQSAWTPGSLGLWVLSILVGAGAGLGAVVFRRLIGIFHNLLFLGKLSYIYDANVHTPPSPWGPFVILVPVAGALGVALLVKNFAPEVKGAGVPEVMSAIYHHKGVIRPRVTVVKALASSLSIGSGGSIGREGPILQIGASIGSTIGQRLRLPVWQRVTLIAAGAGGGIAATFNTPIGGILFAIEIVLHEFSARTLVPLVTATAVATYIGRLFFGAHPSFFVPVLETAHFELDAPWLLIAYASLGVVTGIVSAVFIHSIYATEHVFETYVRGGYYAQHTLGMLLVGCLLFAFQSGFGHYYVEGVGYATIEDLLTAPRLPLYLIILLFAGKLATTALTLGSGASGGVFSPSLFLGATGGAIYGIALNWWFPSLAISPPAFALAGMAGVVGGATGAAMAAVVMVFEMTLDYNMIIPLALTVAISYAVRKSIIRDSVYTRKLTLRGERVPEALRADLAFALRAADVMRPNPGILAAAAELRQFSGPLADRDRPLLVTDGASEVVGVIASREVLTRLAQAQPHACLADVAESHYAVVQPRDSFWEVASEMRSVNANIALVSSKTGNLRAGDVQGMIVLTDILDILRTGSGLFDGEA